MQSFSGELKRFVSENINFVSEHKALKYNNFFVLCESTVLPVERKIFSKKTLC